jgi:hypothetical protein
MTPEHRTLRVVLSHILAVLVGAGLAVYIRQPTSETLASAADRPQRERPAASSASAAISTTTSAVGSRRHDSGAQPAEDGGVVAPSSRADAARAYEMLISWIREQERLAALQDHPEEMAGSLDLYLAGWAEAILHASPDLAPDIARRLTETLCDSEPTSLVFRLLVLQLAARFAPGHSELRAGVGCEIERDRGDEGVALWQALDIWRLASYGPDRRLESLAAESSDPRTQRRLLTHAQERELPQETEREVIQVRSRARPAE